MVRHWILVITKVYLLWHDLALVEKERASEFEKIKELRKNGQQNEYEKSLTALSNKPIPLSLFCRFESNEEKRLYYSPQIDRRFYRSFLIMNKPGENFGWVQNVMECHGMSWNRNVMEPSHRSLWVLWKFMGPMKVYGSHQKFMGPIKKIVHFNAK